MNAMGELRDEPGSPEALFAEWAARVESGEALDFDEFVREHAAHAEALNQLHDDWKLFAPILGKVVPGLIASDSGIAMPSLTGGPDADDDEPPDELLLRLGVRAPNENIYRFRAVIGRGGGGVVLKVWDTKLNRPLAMKVVLGHGEDRPTGHTPKVDGRTLTRFVDEARIAGQLNHPGIAPVHELGADETGRAFFTMKLVRGEDLSMVFEHVRTGKEGWNQTRALSVLLKVCEAMSYAHDKGVIHRDLKPANVMVGKYGEVYVMDWGLAHVRGREDRHDLRVKPLPESTRSVLETERREQRGETADSPLVTMDGEVVGTPSFMPPEQARGQLDQLGPHSDVYSVGAMLYQLLSGHMPYVSAAARASPRTILAAVLNGPPVPLHELVPRTPGELIAICEKAMSRDWAQRYSNMKALSDDLRSYLERRVVHAYEAGAWAEAKKWVQRNRPLATSIAAALLLALGGLAWFSVVQSKAREAMAAKNTELAAAIQDAQKSQDLSLSNEQLAKSNATRATEQEQLATQKANDVLSLSASKNLEERVARAKRLWPPHPDLIREYENWLAESRALIDGRPADPAHNIKKRPGLEEHKAKLADLRLRATKQSAADVQAERESHPRFEELTRKRAELTWRSRMLRLEPWPSQAEVESRLAQETLPSDARGLNDRAWPFVDPDNLVYGDEVRGLLLAQKAVAAATDAERAWIRESLAWANFRLCRLDEAVAEQGLAFAEAPSDKQSEFKGQITKLGKAVACWRGDGALADRRRERTALLAAVSNLDRVVSERRTWDFENSEDSWWQVQLAILVSDLEALRDPKTGLMGDTLAEPFGWGVMKRYEFAKTIQARSIDGPEARQHWAEAIAAISTSQKYGGLKLTPQLGLLPIGEDPESHLWEFAHLQTGEPAIRGANGELVLAEATGLVLVLIPGGTFWMGAQSTQPTEANYDLKASADEQPVKEVALAPYFLSKDEMTQGQWMRITGSNPSEFGPHNYNTDWNVRHLPADLRHPVEQVSWVDCKETLERLGLVLPTEAQWERAARAETDTPWWTGDDLESLAGAANLSDSYGKNHGNETWSVWEKDFDDGSTVHMAVGSYRANGYGLRDVHGNLYEWCQDGYGSYDLPVRAGDGERRMIGPRNRVFRGGSFLNNAFFARSASRRSDTQEYRVVGLGLRPARAVTP